MPLTRRGTLSLANGEGPNVLATIQGEYHKIFAILFDKKRRKLKNWNRGASSWLFNIAEFVPNKTRFVGFPNLEYSTKLARFALYKYNEG